jgi:hypothetical protein
MTMSRTEATPPAIVSADDMLKKLRAGVKEISEINIRGLSFVVRIISINEMLDIRAKAKSIASTRNGDITLENALVQQLTLIAASTINKGAPGLPESFLSKVSLSELTLIYEEYLKFYDDCNPSLERIGQAQMEALIEAIKKNTISWRDCSLSQLRAVFMLYQDMIQRQDSQESQKDS